MDKFTLAGWSRTSSEPEPGSLSAVGWAPVLDVAVGVPKVVFH
jgi:hypothetical protein